MTAQILNPAGWPRPKGYSNGIVVSGRQFYIAGQIGWDTQGRFVSDQLADQVKQALLNICAVLSEAQAGPEHIVRLTWYLTSREEYHANLPAIGAAYAAVLGKNFPAMSVVAVTALMEARAKVEIEATAVVPAFPAPAARQP
jgi:enamine deaminase RidA (YjgF/YER057c/UK114 family)